MLARRTTSTPTAWTCIVVSADLGLHQDGALFGDNFSRLDNASGDGVLGFTTDRVNSYQRRSSPGHCLVENLLDGHSSIERLIRSIVVVVMLEPSQPAPCAGWTPPPERVKAADPHCHGLKQLLDQITLSVVELSAQLTLGKSSQIPAGVDEKLGICDLVFGGESVEEHRRGIGPASAEHLDIEQ